MQQRDKKIIFNNISRYVWRSFLTHLMAVPEKRKGAMAEKQYLKRKIIGNCPELKRADDIAIKNTLTYREF